jgi:hypothetical protein
MASERSIELKEIGQGPRVIKRRETVVRDRTLRGKARVKARKAGNKK